MQVEAFCGDCNQDATKVTNPLPEHVRRSISASVFKFLHTRSYLRFAKKFSNLLDLERLTCSGRNELAMRKHCAYKALSAALLRLE